MIEIIKNTPNLISLHIYSCLFVYIALHLLILLNLFNIFNLEKERDKIFRTLIIHYYNLYYFQFFKIIKVY